MVHMTLQVEVGEHFPVHLTCLIIQAHNNLQKDNTSNTFVHMLCGLRVMVSQVVHIISLQNSLLILIKMLVYTWFRNRFLLQC
jgi:hypothetical protein